jgi:hypothetical protein
MVTKGNRRQPRGKHTTEYNRTEVTEQKATEGNRRQQKATEGNGS